jgi:antitoxin ParD1/3/4
MTTKPIGFRPNAEDQRILDDVAREGQTATTALRRGLRLLDHERWLDQARADAARIRDEDLDAEPDAW